jgi:hypothetical protein
MCSVSCRERSGDVVVIVRGCLLDTDLHRFSMNPDLRLYVTNAG